MKTNLTRAKVSVSCCGGKIAVVIFGFGVGIGPVFAGYISKGASLLGAACQQCLC